VANSSSEAKTKKDMGWSTLWYADNLLVKRESIRRIEVFVQACGRYPESEDLSSCALKLYGMLGTLCLRSLGRPSRMLTQDRIQLKKKLATYDWWFATPKVEEDGQYEPGFPPEMPRYICWMGRWYTLCKCETIDEIAHMSSSLGS
jgi:hypothetical protein